MEGDIEIELKRLKKAAVSPTKIIQFTIICNLAFAFIVRRTLNSRSLRAFYLSFLPEYIFAASRNQTECKAGTSKSLLAAVLSWLKSSQFPSATLIPRNNLLKVISFLFYTAKMLRMQARMQILVSNGSSKKDGSRYLMELFSDNESIVVDLVSLEFLSSTPVGECKGIAKLECGGLCILALPNINKRTPPVIAAKHAKCILEQLNTDTADCVDGQPGEVEIPNSLAKLKNHPVFVIESHLKKYEVIYPADIAGFVGNETIYYRKNVQKVRSKEAWLTQYGKILKNGEQPVKIVRLSEKTNKMQELFGEWQVTNFVPQKCIGNTVPKNSFGNIDLFQPSMLPEECVHITLEDAAKIASKVGIEYAEACIGFSFHGGRAAPNLHGIVILKRDEQRFLSVLFFTFFTLF